METTLAKCPECGQVSDSIKAYKLPNYFLFLFVYARWQEIRYICCPHCMRKHILMKCFTYNILAANFAWPILVLPWAIVLLVCSYTKGHSKVVLDMLE